MKASHNFSRHLTNFPPDEVERYQVAIELAKEKNILPGVTLSIGEPNLDTDDFGEEFFPSPIDKALYVKYDNAPDTNLSPFWEIYRGLQ
jgi:hypothetical protein